MSRQVLLLNASWEPLRVISWQRAVVMMTLDKVEVIEEYDRMVRSVATAFRMPAVVRLYRYVHGRILQVRFSRTNIHARDRHTCQYCGRLVPPSELSCDHVFPRRLGGKSTWDNVVTACVTCNRRKGGRTPEQAGMKLKRRPRRPDFLPSRGISADPAAPGPRKGYLPRRRTGHA